MMTSCYYDFLIPDFERKNTPSLALGYIDLFKLEDTTVLLSLISIGYVSKTFHKLIFLPS